MKRTDLVLRSLLHNAGTHAAVTFACATACAIIAGALIVGDSVTGSLRRRALERLGGVDVSLVSPRFFREDLAADLGGDQEIGGAFESVVPIVLLRGTVTHASTDRRAAGVRVIGVDERFARLTSGPSSWLPEGRSAAMNRRLARELGAAEGDPILIHFPRASDVSREFALGSRDDAVERLRVTLSEVRPDQGLALFDLRNQQQTPRNVFVPLSVLQRALDVPGRVNALLVDTPEKAEFDRRVFQRAIRRHWKLADLRLRLRRNDEQGYIALESDEFLLPGAVKEPVRQAIHEAGVPYLEVFTYLANSIELARGEGSIPYSTVTALGQWTYPDGRKEAVLALSENAQLEPGDIVLTSWAAKDLDASAGDTVRLEYFAVAPDEDLVEEAATLELSGIVSLEGAVADPGWTPRYPGITDARTFGDWDAPFEIDHDRVRKKDEEYWEEHRTTPKAFVTLEDGQALWASRFGDLTSVRARAVPEKSLTEIEDAVRGALLAELEPEAFGLLFEPVRRRAIEAAESGTDFALLFISLSSFIIIAALLLVAMTYRLSLERRGRELGMLRAVGFSRKELRWLLLAEGLGIGIAGSLLGLAGGVGYAAALIAGLRSWWRDAVNAPFLSLHVAPESLPIAFAATVLLVLITLFLVARRAAGRAPRALLAGAGFSEEGRRLSARRRSLWIGVGLIALAFLTFLAARLGLVATVVGFFLLAALLLAGGMALFHHALTRRRARALRGRGVGALVRLGALNARRAPGRSLLTVGLIASATFVVVTVAASRHDPSEHGPALDSGDGGFAIVARASVPLYESLRSEDGRYDLNIRESVSRLIETSSTGVYAFRERPGDETSCLNLYRPLEPRILGAPERFLERGGFAWASSLAETPEEEENPWLLLEREWTAAGGGATDGGGEGGALEVIPAVVDQNTVTWVLKSGLGGDIEVTDGLGRRVKLRIVGLLSRSIFQGALVVPEREFLEHFPRLGGWSTFLVECAPPDVEELIDGLERDLAAYGFDAQRSGELLASFQAVVNTYLSTFFVLGGLGLLLGTLGLGATQLRNVLERRGELALLRALGYSRRELGWLVASESLSLLIVGVGLGAGAAFIATFPNISGTGSEVSWGLLAATLALVIVCGFGSSFAALASALRAPLLPALRRE